MMFRLLTVAFAVCGLASCSTMQGSTGAAGFSEREQIVEVVNKLFYHTDEQNWDALQSEVFADQVLFDMTSVGAPAVETLPSQKITEMWDAGFEGLDAIHHQAGNYIVSLDGDSAAVKAYAIASHYKESATEGKLREFIGSYDIGLVKHPEGWRIDAFKYNLKYLDGNLPLN